MQTDVVTGAFGYSGAAIARELRAAGHQVRTLTGHPRAQTDRNGPGAGDIDTRPLDFGDPEALVNDLTGAHTLYCTYWVRFPHGQSTRESAVTNSKVLFDAAARAGVERIVYISILHADAGSPYPYFSGKAEVERHLAATGVPYAIARPSILFGSSDGLGSAASVLVNNIAWLLRHLPVFGIGDGGGYRVRPIEVDDLARLCAELGGRTDNVTVDAVGPDAPTFRELVTAIRSATGSRSLLVPAPGWLIPPLAAALGAALRDVLLTTEEYRAMADGLATSDSPSTGQASLMDWIAAHGGELGRTYANELDRHYRPARLGPGLSSRPGPNGVRKATCQYGPVAGISYHWILLPTYRSSVRSEPSLQVLMVRPRRISRVAAVAPGHPLLDLGEAVCRVHHEHEQRGAQGQVLLSEILRRARHQHRSFDGAGVATDPGAVLVKQARLALVTFRVREQRVPDVAVPGDQP
jgi:uncharacterized protein YbjT (DUF2867 family)